MPVFSDSIVRFVKLTSTIIVHPKAAKAAKLRSNPTRMILHFTFSKNLSQQYCPVKQRSRHVFESSAAQLLSSLFAAASIPLLGATLLVDADLPPRRL